MSPKFTAVLEKKYDIQQNGNTLNMRSVAIKNHKNKTIQIIQTLNNPLGFETALKENGWKIAQQLDNQNFVVEPYGVEAEKKAKEDQNKKAVVSCCGILVLLFFIVFVIGFTASLNADPTAEGKSEISATVYCEEAAKKHLIETPSTAEFSRMQATHTGDIQNEDTWQVIGYVEYDNAIGGRSGSDFRCSLKYDQNTDQWSGRATFK